MFYSILAQVKHNLKTRKCKAVFAVILGFVLANYLQNVFRYAGYDVIDMYHPMKLRLLVATDNPLGIQFHVRTLIFHAAFSISCGYPSIICTLGK